MEDDVESFEKQTGRASTSLKKEAEKKDGENDNQSDEGLMFAVDESSNR